MDKLRPFQVVIMAVFGLIALSGLFLFANFQGFTGGVKPVGSVTIWGTLPDAPMYNAISLLAQEHPEYGRVSYVERPAATFDTDLAEAIASGKGPDLIIITQEQLLASVSKISLIPSSSISERTFKDSYLSINELYLTKGGTYAIPFVVDPLMLFYNRPILASAGVATPPSTWESVMGLANVLTRQTETQTITKSLIALGTYENVENARGILSLLFLQGGSTVSENTTTGMSSSLTNAPPGALGVVPAESALNFYTEFANPAKTVYSWNRSFPGSRETFIAGDLALYLGFASERKELAAANPNLDFDVAAVPQPGTSGTRITYGKAYAFAIPKASTNAAGAFRAAMGLSGKDTLPAIAHELGMAPAQRALLAPASGDLYEPVYFPEALIARGWLSPAPQITDRIFATMVGNVTSGREGTRDALFTAEQSLDAAFRSL